VPILSFINTADNRTVHVTRFSCLSAKLLTSFMLSYGHNSCMVSMLDSGTVGPGFKSHLQCCQDCCLRHTVHTRCASVHQAAKLLAALLRVGRVTAGLAESNCSLLPGFWLMSAAGWLPWTGMSSETLHSVIRYGLLFYSHSSLELKLNSGNYITRFMELYCSVSIN